MKLLRTRRLSIFLVLAALTVQTGCAAGAAKEAMAPSAHVADVAPQPSPPSVAPASDVAMPAAPAAAGGAPRAASPAPPPPPAQQGAKTESHVSAKNAGPSTRAAVIIFQGEMKMLADEEQIPKTIDRIIDVAESLGGHVAGRKDNSVQIKVPSASFREAMTKIDAFGGVTSRSVQADDVSEEFHDLEVRLTNLKATRARLQDFLAKANGIGDMLTVERELERVAQEIDRIEGRLEFLRTRAAMSVINVGITAKPKAAVAIVTPPPPNKERTPDLPIAWVRDVGLDTLLSLRR